MAEKKARDLYDTTGLQVTHYGNGQDVAYFPGAERLHIALVVLICGICCVSSICWIYTTASGETVVVPDLKESCSISDPISNEVVLDLTRAVRELTQELREWRRQN